MTQAQHTPGPWHISRLGSLDIVANDPAGTYIAEVLSGDGPLSPTSIANARLISAAPDLLAALQAMLTITDRKHYVWDEARAVIAKATGQPARLLSDAELASFLASLKAKYEGTAT